MMSLAYLSAAPTVTAGFKQQLADFIVNEQLPFAASGDGEHWLLEVEKQGENTIWAAEQLARVFRVKPGDVSYAGLKDRQGITTQWFSVWQPKGEAIDLARLPASLRVKQCQRHKRKLRRGALLANDFVIRLRNVSDIAALEQQLVEVSENGVPNYFGPQRFGHDGQNLAKAKAMFAGKRIKNKNQRGLYLSAARSYLFNQLASARIEAGLANTLMAGDCLMLAGKRSFFTCEAVTDELKERLAIGDIQISAPLVGDGELTSAKDAQIFEKKQLDLYTEWVKGLARSRMAQERRPLLLQPQQLRWEQQGDDMVIQFRLPPGCYATSVLRELVDVVSSQGE